MKTFTHRRYLSCLGLAALAFSCFVTAVPANALDINKALAAYLYHFFNFTRWPAGSIPAGRGFVNLCLVGSDEVQPELAAIEGQTAGGLRLRILRMTPSASFEQCQALFISYRSDALRDEILHKTNGLPTLTLSTTPGFAHAGGVVEFVRVEDRLRMKINTQAMADNHLQISSKLLAIAEIVSR